MKKNPRIIEVMEETLRFYFLEECNSILSSEEYNNVYDNLQLPITTICWTYQAYYPFD